MENYETLSFIEEKAIIIQVVRKIGVTETCYLMCTFKNETE